jgi:site-specific recombinase XerD
MRLAVAAYLARFKGASRHHTESDLRCYLAWCADQGLDPLAARRPHLELYIRWMQEVRRFKPSTVSRRFSVTAGFYRTCVIDGLLEHSPAEHVRRPSVPPESPTLGFTTCNSRPCSPPPGNQPGHVTSRSSPCSGCSACASSKQPGPTSPISAKIARPDPHMLRHTYVTTMLDAGVDLRDVQIAARHADPRTTMRYDRARKNLDRHPNYILAAYMASGT